MTSGILYEQGDIVIVPFPFTDLSAAKQRPVLIISRNEYNSNTEDVITCGITSNFADTLHSVFIDNTHLLNGQIPVPSRIKVDKLFTVHQSIIKKKLCKLNKKTFEKVKEELFNLL